MSKIFSGLTSPFVNIAWCPTMWRICSNRSLHLSIWLPRNTQTLEWPGFWWASINLCKLYMAFSHDEFHHPHLGEPTGLRAWHPIKSVAHISPKHMHRHYETVGFASIWTASASPPTPKRGVNMGNGLLPHDFLGFRVFFQIVESVQCYECCTYQDCFISKAAEGAVAGWNFK